MRRIKRPRMTLPGRIVLFLLAFGAAMAIQIGIGCYQTKCVLEPLEKRSESIQNISRFLNDAEGCMTALELQNLMDWAATIPPFRCCS